MNMKKSLKTLKNKKWTYKECVELAQFAAQICLDTVYVYSCKNGYSVDRDLTIIPAGANILRAFKLGREVFDFPTKITPMRVLHTRVRYGWKF